MKTPDLKECREKLDGIDREIVRLFEERMAVCGQVAAASRTLQSRSFRR